MNDSAPVEPLWRQIESVLFNEIRAGIYRDTQRLPSEVELAEAFGVNRHTVRQALAALADRGILFKRKGAGSYLSPGIVDYLIGARTRFSANLLLQDRSPDRQILDAGEFAATERISRALALPPGGRVAFAYVMGGADGIPLSVGHEYVPADRFPGFSEIYRAKGSVSQALAHFGIKDYTRKTTRIISTLPSEINAKHLRQPPTTPVLSVESVDVDDQGHPISFHEMVFAGDRVQFILG